MGYFLLVLSLVTSITANICVKLSYGFTRKLASISAFVFYGLCGLFLVLTVRYMELGVLYGIWAGLTVSGTALLGMLFFGESSSRRKLISIGIIIVGVILLQLETH